MLPSAATEHENGVSHGLTLPDAAGPGPGPFGPLSRASRGPTIVGMRRPPPQSPADREALRALIVDALDDLAAGPDSRRSAEDLMRALDAYIESAPVPAPAVVTPDPAPDVRPAVVLWGVLACGIVATLVAAVLLPGGAWAGIAILGIWVAVIVLLAST